MRGRLPLIVVVLVMLSLVGCRRLVRAGLGIALSKKVVSVRCGRFHCQAEVAFRRLAVLSGMKLRRASSARYVDDRILEILRGQPIQNADIVFLVDKTGSMKDDIHAVRAALHPIITELSRNKVRLGVATYGDRYADGARWYGALDLSRNYRQARRYINSIRTTGGGDTPESVYDALVRTMQQMSWRSKTNRIIILMGDAPPLTGRRTQFNELDVRQASRTFRIQFHPILINM